MPKVTPSLTCRPVADGSLLSYDVANTHLKGLSTVGEFGDKFRKAREKKELSLDDISNVTKISSRMLQAIEQEHFDQLPGGVFNKGFIRAYAKHLGLDSEDAVTDYLACLRQAQIDSHAGWDAEPHNGRSAPLAQKNTPATPAKVEPKAQPVKFQPIKAQPPAEAGDELPELQLPRAEHIRGGKKEYLSRASSGNPRLFFALIAVFIIAGVLFWIRHSRGTRGTVSKSNESSVTASAAAPAPPVGSPSASGSSAAPAPSSSFAPSNSVTAPNPVVAPADAPPAVQQATPTTGTPATAAPATQTEPTPESDDLPVKRSSRTPPTTVADPTQVKVERKGDVTIRSFGSGAPKPADKSATSLTLVVRASENSWISVTSDGQLLTQETLIAPAATSFHANRELVVRVGNAAGISFLYKGEELPPQGGEAEAKTFIFDAQGMRAQAPAQAPAQN
jgi:cytoskeletal protein RodZ